jgi:hypothetical protein
MLQPTNSTLVFWSVLCFVEKTVMVRAVPNYYGVLQVQSLQLKLIKVMLLDSEVSEFFRNYTYIKLPWFLSNTTTSITETSRIKFKMPAFQIELTIGFNGHAEY